MKLNRTIIAGLIVVLAALAIAALASAAARVDPTWGDGGTVITPAALGSTSADAITQDHRGRIVAGGSTHGRLIITRYRGDGEVDTTFGEDGFVRLAMNDDAGIAGIAIQPDGRILMAGYVNYGPLSRAQTCTIVIRLLPNGTLDSSFNSAGDPGWRLVCATRGGTRDAGLEARALALQPDGKILVGGTIHPSLLRSGGYLLRLNENGSTDRSFRGNRRTHSGYPGVVAFIPRSGDYSSIEEIRLIGRGRIVAGGKHRDRFMVARFHRDGTFDRNFGRGGMTTLDLDGSERCGCSVGTGLTRDRRGRILLVGYVYSDRVLRSHLVLIRFSRDGRVDRSFSRRGVVRLRPAEQYAYGWGVAVQRDGRIVVVGERDAHFLVARYLPSGRRDSSFFGDGIFAERPGGGGAAAYDVLIDSAGRVVVSGAASPAGNPFDYGFVLKRFLPR